MTQTKDWHRNVEFVTGDDLRAPPERPSQASGAARHHQQVRQRRIRSRRVQRLRRG